MVMRLASFRHELHCNKEDCFYCECGNYDYFMQNLDADVGGDNCLCYNIQQEFGVNLLNGIHLSRWETDSEILEDDTYTQDDIDNAICLISNELEIFNSNVKHFLIAIDVKFNTSFATSEYEFIVAKYKKSDTAQLSVSDIYNSIVGD